MQESSRPCPPTGPAALRRRTRIGAVVLTLSLAIACAALGSAHTAAQIRNAAGDAALQAARDMAERLSTQMAARVREVDLLSQLDLLRDPAAVDRVAMRTLLAQLRDGLPAYAWIGLTDADGRVVAGTSGVLEDQSIAARPVFRNGRLGPWTGDVHDAVLLAAYAPPRPGGSVQFVDVAAPVHTVEGRLRGVVALHLSWQWAAALRDSVLEANGDPASLRLQVVGADGGVLLRPATEAPPQAAAPALTLATLQRLDDRWQTIPWTGGRTAVAASVPSRPSGQFKGFGWRVVAYAEPDATDAAVARAERGIWSWSAALGAGFAALVAWLLSGTALTLGPRGGHAGSPLVRADRRTPADDAATTTMARLKASIGGNGGPDRTDALTGLPTHADLARLSRELGAQTSAATLELCVLRLDLDDFRAVNDRFGRDAGDVALKQVAARVQDAARGDDIVLRLGGDEFLVIAAAAEGAGEATTLLLGKRLLERMQPAFDGIAPARLKLGGCIGTSRSGLAGPQLAEAVAQAGEALLVAKRAGRGELRHYASRRGKPARSAPAAAT